jgi:polyhydroxyalkanoate synthase
MKAGPSRRLGPRPLPLHLMAQASILLGSYAALPRLKNGSLDWKPHLRTRAEALRRDLDGLDADSFTQALMIEAGRRADGFARGVQTYRHHPYRREMTEAPEVWSEGTTRLLDYSAAGADGIPVLVVPSLINRAHILDLLPRRSLMRHFARRGFRPYLVDWDRPQADEADFGLEDYISGRLAKALDVVLARAGRPALLGYCMGGLLALPLGLAREADVLGLGLLATPWDFHQPNDLQARLISILRQPLEHAIALYRGLPVDLLQTLFATIDFSGIERKFRTLADLPAGSAQLRDLVAIEDWLNDGVPLAAKVARECLFDWYVDNGPARGLWRIGGRTVTPAAFSKPVLVVIPARDRLVPPESALAIAEQAPNVAVRKVQAGHIGMIAGRRSQREVADPVAAWLDRLPI